MSLSQLARSIRESATLKLNETAALLRDKGEPIIHLGGGEPKSKAPIDAVINCASLLNTGEIRYTAPDGIPALKKAMIRYTEDHYKKIVSADNVIASGGAKQVPDGAVARHPGSEGRSDFPGALLGELSGDGEARRAVFRCRSRRRTERSIQPSKRSPMPCGSYTKAIILNSPNNPFGRHVLARISSRYCRVLREEEHLSHHGRHLNRLVFDGKTPHLPTTSWKRRSRNPSWW